MKLYRTLYTTEEGLWEIVTPMDGAKLFMYDDYTSDYVSHYGSDLRAYKPTPKRYISRGN